MPVTQPEDQPEDKSEGEQSHDQGHFTSEEIDKVLGLLKVLGLKPPSDDSTLNVLKGRVRPDKLTLANTNYLKREFTGDFKTQLDVITPWVSGSIHGEEKTRTFIEDYNRYEDIAIPGLNHVLIRYGVSLRIQVEISDIKTEAKITSLPLIAASASLGLCSSKIAIQSRGLPTLNLPDSLFKLSNFDVQSYAEISVALGKLMECIDQPDFVNLNGTAATEPISEAEKTIRGNYKPQILFLVAMPIEENFNEAVAITYSLASIANGKSYDEAKLEDTDKFAQTVKSVYESFGISADVSKPSHPSDSQQYHAKNYLRGLHIKTQGIWKHSSIKSQQ